MFLVHVNYLAVLLSTIAAMVIGFLWYGTVFGKLWMDLVGMPKNKKAPSSDVMMKTYGIMFVTALVMAYVLAHLVWYAAPGSLTVMIAVKTAIWAWLGFVITTLTNQFITRPERRPTKLLVLEGSYYLVVLIVMGVIFAILK